MLADACHDVWVGDNRGTVNSYRHTNPEINENTAAYWNFTFDEIGRFDTLANIEFVRSRSNNQKVIYIGHSQGTIQFFIQNCLNSSFAQNIKAFGALSPILYAGNSNSMFIDIQERYHVWDWLDRHFLTYFYLREGRNMLTNAIKAISPILIQIFPRVTWAIVCSYVGYNKV